MGMFWFAHNAPYFFHFFSNKSRQSISTQFFHYNRCKKIHQALSELEVDSDCTFWWSLARNSNFTITKLQVFGGLVNNSFTSCFLTPYVLQNYPTLFHLVKIIFPHHSSSLIELIKKLSVMMMSVIFFWQLAYEANCRCCKVFMKDRIDLGKIYTLLYYYCLTTHTIKYDIYIKET